MIHYLRVCFRSNIEIEKCVVNSESCFSSQGLDGDK